MGQGYLWSRPVELDGAMGLLAAGTADAMEDTDDEVVLAG